MCIFTEFILFWPKISPTPSQNGGASKWLVMKSHLCWQNASSATGEQQFECLALPYVSFSVVFLDQNHTEIPNLVWMPIHLL